MTTWTTPLLAALDESSAPAAATGGPADRQPRAAAGEAAGQGGAQEWFFRDDDAGWADDRFLAVAAAFESRGLCLDVAAIPAAVSAELAKALRRLSTSSSVAVHQHGYQHVNHEALGRRSEFGPTRMAEDQLRDLRGGRGRLAELLDGALQPFFTPPWNRCTEATVRLLEELDFRVLSCDVSARGAAADLVELPVGVDWARRWREGGPRLLAAELEGAIRAARPASGVPSDSPARPAPVGVMLHHATMSDAEVRALGELLDALAGHPSVHLTTMSALARATASAPVQARPPGVSRG